MFLINQSECQVIKLRKAESEELLRTISVKTLTLIGRNYVFLYHFYCLGITGKITNGLKINKFSWILDQIYYFIWKWAFSAFKDSFLKLI